MIASMFPGELPPKDREALSHSETSRWFAEMVLEGVRSGARGPACDWTLSARPWGFRLQDIAFPIHLFYGEADIIVPVDHGRYLAGVIPNCMAKFYPDEGHISVIYNHYEEILYAVIREA